MTEKDYEDLLGCLTRHGVKALIVGAHAVAIHAKPRYTFFFLGKAELIRNKRISARPQDLADLAWLEEES